MKMFAVCILSVVAATSVLAQSQDAGKSPRKWTSIRGETVEASFVKLQAGSVQLRTADGKDMQIDMMELISTDRALIRELAAPPRPNPAAQSVAGAYSGKYKSERWSGALACTITEDSDGELKADWSAEHSDGKKYRYSGAFRKNSEGKYDGLFDVRRPKEFQVTGSFDGSNFAGEIALVDRKGGSKTTGDLTMSRKSDD
ncbi:MAG: hypothetical protein FJ224_04625 [Lentisphaerae bacterium]|nr:hypothetical protein [Lentisphaerota bacterium]